MNNPDLEFPANNAGERDGLGDAGIETFRDAPYASCAREAGQNSRDAAAGQNNPVKMSFDLLEVNRAQIPGVERLEETLSLCLEQAHDDKESEFFKNALSIIQRPQIPVLRIADYNTTGLAGPPDKLGTPFNSLLKARGVSSKESSTSGGSFGIGKNASVAVSELQTVFYSTRYVDPESNQDCFAAQGKVILVSHDGKDSQPRRATGYWGHPDGFRAVTDENLVPDWMRRTDIGTSIFSIGFRGHSSNWEELMVCSLVANFFAAIQQGQMEFTVGKHTINTNTLESLLTSDELLAAAEGTALREELEFARYLHRCQVSALSAEELIEIPSIGKVRVRILSDKDLPRRVGFIRNGMLITDNLGYFGHKFARFPRARDFICLVEPADDDASRLMKSLENPQHRDFSADRIPDPEKRQTATKAMQNLGVRIRSLINSKAGVELADSVVVEELAHLFGEGATNNANNPSSEKTPEKYTYSAVRQVPKRTAPQNSIGAEEGRSGAHQPGNDSSAIDSGNNNNGKRDGNGQTGSSDRRKHVYLKDVRNKVLADGTSEYGKRELYFTSETSGQVELGVQALGVNNPEPLVIKDAYPHKPKNGVVLLSVEAGKRQKLTIQLDEPYEGPIEVIAVQVEAAGGTQ
ncbi:hypothetical protein C8E02_3358 [Vogesella indigofera]|uniref:Uncharacterized protein n=1 Tax=Vogesella indigofera TaxID=45465 RepID=A0A495AVX5_VOGIN|nr:hypothetical protein [Vogesella indigofera]RKQ52889.1 hypothetical protein C8E02_3358 [Vogesella indigofera]